jgi:3',5'-cyclic AMP phosphodiesterase CpdA
VRLAHVSDLHLGTDDPAVVAGLLADVAAQRVDQVLVSGDLTMRARRAQFRAARALLDELGVPWVSVPGNHDLPLDLVLTRAFRPLRAYLRWICPEAEPLRLHDGVLVLGLNTARRYYWKGGRVDAGQIARIGSAFAASVPLKILMVHHPVFVPAARSHRPVRGVDRALRAAAAAGVDVVLCGHDHVQAHVDLALSRPDLGRHVIGVMAGTATSRRVRAGEGQSYNVLSLTDAGRLRLEVRQFRDGRFAPLLAREWTRVPDGWREA